ncbi:MAG: ferredoxin [Candidatus Gastranaerophilales bacterium]|nr:ferredoxin [Candidatus Gastranaerophilales bacterium]
MKVTVEDGCIACGACESFCPDVFSVSDAAEADNSQVQGHEAEVKEAADSCPVGVITVEE